MCLTRRKGEAGRRGRQLCGGPNICTGYFKKRGGDANGLQLGWFTRRRGPPRREGSLHSAARRIGYAAARGRKTSTHPPPSLPFSLTREIDEALHAPAFARRRTSESPTSVRRGGSPPSSCSARARGGAGRDYRVLPREPGRIQGPKVVRSWGLCRRGRRARFSARVGQALRPEGRREEAGGEGREEGRS